MAKSKRQASKAKQAPAKAKQIPKHKVRSTGLTIALVLILIHSLLTVFAYWRYTADPTSIYTPWIVGGLFLVAVAKFVAAAALWKWKRWGLYLFLGACIANVVFGMVLTGTPFVAFNDIFPAILLAWLMRGRMQDFT